MVRPTDQEMMATEKIVYYTHRSQEKEYTSCHRGPHGKAPGSATRPRKRGEG